MASENYTTDEFDSWVTFSPKQQPSELPNGMTSNMLESSSSNSLSVQSSCVSPYDSGCRSPDRDYVGNNSPLSSSFNQAQQHIENFVPNIDTPFVPNYTIWYNPILSPSLDSSQNFLNDDMKREWKTEAISGNSSTLSAAQKKRREQNRAAQRNFRQRKEVHLKYLQSTIVDAEARRNSLQQDNDYLQRELARLSIENNQLRRGPPCSRHDCATEGKLRLDISSSGQIKCDKNSSKISQGIKNEKTIKIITKTPKSENSQDNTESGASSSSETSNTSAGKDNKSDLGHHLPPHVNKNPESPANCESSRSSTFGSGSTNCNAKDSTDSSCTSTSISSSRTGSVSNMSCESSSNIIPICGNCNRKRPSKDKLNEIKVKDMEYRNSARILICSQEALRKIQSHELFQKGFIDIEQLLCALRQTVRYYEGAAVFDRTELESIMRECAKDGQSDELI